MEIPSVGDLRVVVRGKGCCWSSGACSCCRGGLNSLTCAWVTLVSVPRRPLACEAMHSDPKTRLF